MSESWASMQYAFERGGIARGNLEGVLHAEAQRVEFRGGTNCPKGCGSVIAYQVDLPSRTSITRHTDDPAACMQHPANRK